MIRFPGRSRGLATRAARTQTSPNAEGGSCLESTCFRTPSPRRRGYAERAAERARQMALVREPGAQRDLDDRQRRRAQQLGRDREPALAHERAGRRAVVTLEAANEVHGMHARLPREC